MFKAILFVGVTVKTDMHTFESVFHFSIFLDKSNGIKNKLKTKTTSFLCNYAATWQKCQNYFDLKR